MNPSELINQLSKDLTPVKPMPRLLWREIAYWSLALLVVVVGIIYWYGRKAEFHIPEGRSFLELVLLLVTTVVGGHWAIRSSSPHFTRARIPRYWWWAPALWAILLLGLFIAGYLVAPKEALVALQYNTWLCPIVISSVAIPAALFLTAYIHRGVVLYPGQSGLFVSLSSMALGVIALSFICPWADPLHELLWHVAPTFLLTSFCALTLPFIFKKVWRR